MAAAALPEFVREHYEIHDFRHALAILQQDFPGEWSDIVEVLTGFRLLRDDIVAKGGRKSRIATALDSRFLSLGWKTKRFRTHVVVDGMKIENPTHEIDCYKNQVALEVEWNNKDPFFDRDLNNFRVLFELRAIGVGIVVTRCDELQRIFDRLGKGKSYGQSTTHMSRLLSRAEGGGAGGCPVLLFGITKKLYVE